MKINFEKRLTKYAQDLNFSGNISIFKGKNTVYNNSFGYRNISNKILNNNDTIFGIASGTKTFTALGIFKLIELELLELTTTVYDIFKKDLGYINSNTTIKQLLTHSSGIFDYYDEELITDFDNYEVEIPWFKLETPSDYIPLFESKIKKFEPGERVSYSNGGYVFLGYIIEKLSGKSYRDFMFKNIFKPLDMVNSGFYAFNSLPQNVATGYMPINDNFVSNIYQLPIRGAGDGGMYTNSIDILKLWTKIFSNELISKLHMKLFCNNEVEIFENQNYGLGIYISKFEDKECYFIDGCDAGVGFTSLYVPSLDININVFSNITDGNEGIMDFIRKNSIYLL